MKSAKNPLRDSYRGILILVAVLLVHLTLFLAFRHQVIWPSPPVNTDDFAEFKMTPPTASLTNVPMPVSPPAVVVTPPNPLPEARLPQIHLSMPSSMEAALPGSPVQPREDSESPGYFAVPAVAAEEHQWIFGPIFSNPVFGTPGLEHYHPAGSSLTSPSFGTHVQVGELRKTEPH